jgi:hypothetical protein
MIQHCVVTISCMMVAAVGQIPLSTLLAQSPLHVTGTEDLFWKLLNTLGAMGILAWYFYQTQTKTIPDKDAQLQAERAACDVKVKATLDATTLEMKNERETHKESIDRLVDELKAEREARMLIIQKCGLNQ